MYVPKLSYGSPPTQTPQPRQRSRFRYWYSKTWQLVLVGSLICLIVGFVKQDDFKHTNYFPPELLREPIQTPTDATPIEYDGDGFHYTLTPVAEYDMAALVIHSLIYDRWYSLSRVDKTFTMDLCVMWGKNLSSGAYALSSLSVKQDFRFCMYRYEGSLPVDSNSFANNHLIARNADVQKILQTIRPGDQVRLSGKLVNVAAQRIGSPKGNYEPAQPSWTTSTTRTDTGAGACEVLYVEQVHILHEGNMLYRRLYTVGTYGLLLVGIFSVLSFLYYAVRIPFMRYQPRR